MSELPKVYIYPAGKFGGEDVVMVAMNEDASFVLSHVCSDPSWAYEDLHVRRQVKYEEKFGGFGDGQFYEIVQVKKADDIPLDVLVAAGMRNPDGSRPSKEEM